MLKSLLLKYKFRFGLGILILCAFGAMYLNFKLIVARKDKIIEQANIEIFNHLKSDSLAKITEANRKAEIDGLFLIQKRETIKWKDQYFEILNAQQDTTETGGIRVSFVDSNKCMKVKGHTVTATELDSAFAVCSLSSYPIGIKRDYMDIGGKIMEIITPENDCIKFVNNKFDAAPGLYRTRIEGRSWFGYGFGAGTTIFEEENNKWGYGKMEIMAGIRFWSIHTILSTNVNQTKLGLMYWR